jgi:hypothetical protein
MMRLLRSRCAGLFRRARLDAALDEEVRAHLDLLAADYQRQGMSATDARLAARKAFGGVPRMQEAYREQRAVPWLDDVLRDMRYGVRMLARTAGSPFLPC